MKNQKFILLPISMLVLSSCNATDISSPKPLPSISPIPQTSIAPIPASSIVSVVPSGSTPQTTVSEITKPTYTFAPINPSSNIVTTLTPSIFSQPTSSSSAYLNYMSTIRGNIVDDTNKGLDDVTIKAISLNSAKPYEQTVTSSAGRYEITKAPTGVTIEVTASKKGYTTRTRTIVPLS